MINKKSHFSIKSIGHEKSPLIIIDDFLLKPAAVIEEACSLSYISRDSSKGKERLNNYPGIRASVGGDYGMALLQAIAPIFYQVLNVPDHLTLHPIDGCYSLLTQEEHALALRQCIPHYDNTLTYSFAVVHYLNEGNFGGTGFYRHKPSGFENITEQRKMQYFSTAQQFIDTFGNPQQQYFTQSTDHYELIEVVAYKPNRVVIYPSSILHSAFITNPQHDVNSDIATGRLTANFFLQFR